MAIITGGSRGIGAATARLAAERGCAVCVNYRRNREAADASHADAGVRLEAIETIALPENRGMEGAAGKLVTLAETDPDPRVRHAACENAGRVGGDAVISLYERTTTAGTDPEQLAACMEGLVAMFHDHPSFDTASVLFNSSCGRPRHPS